jgi:MoaA/NifB/PqqE/SkfB family radical SAM enzyme
MNSAGFSKQIGIEVKITDHCNLKCFHCVNMDNGRSGLNIDHDLIINRLYEWGKSSHRSRSTIEELRITGGEPLLNFRSMIEIINCCSELGIRSGVNTNGSLITMDVARHLKAAGMTVMKVSLDSMQEKVLKRIRGSAASLEKSLNGIKIAVDSGFKVVVRFTLCRLNSSQLFDCYEFARLAGVSKFQVKPLINAGRAMGSGEFMAKTQIRLLLEKLSKAATDSPTIPEILCWHPGETFGMPAKACGSIDKIYISTDGRVCTCNFLPSGWAEDLTRHRLEEIILNKESNVISQKINGFDILPRCPQYFCG